MMRILDPTIRLTGISAAAHARASASDSPAPAPRSACSPTASPMAWCSSIASPSCCASARGIGEVVRVAKANASVPVTEEQSRAVGQAAAPS